MKEHQRWVQNLTPAARSGREERIVDGGSDCDSEAPPEVSGGGAVGFIHDLLCAPVVPEDHHEPPKIDHTMDLPVEPEDEPPDEPKKAAEASPVSPTVVDVLAATVWSVGGR